MGKHKKRDKEKAQNQEVSTKVLQEAMARKEVPLFMKAAIRLSNLLGLNKVLALVLVLFIRLASLLGLNNVVASYLPPPPPPVPPCEPSSSAPSAAVAELDVQLSKMQAELDDLRAKVEDLPLLPPPPPPPPLAVDDIAEMKARLSKVQTEVDELRAGKKKTSLPVNRGGSGAGKGNLQGVFGFAVRDVSAGTPPEEAKSFLSLIGRCSKGKVLAMGRLRDFFPSKYCTHMRSNVNPLVMLVLGDTIQTRWKDLEPVTVSIAGYTLKCEVVRSLGGKRYQSGCIVETVADEMAYNIPYATVGTSAYITGPMIIVHDESHAINFTVDGEFSTWVDEDLPVPGAQPGDLVLEVTPNSFKLMAVVAETSPESCLLLCPRSDFVSGQHESASRRFFEKYPERRVSFHTAPL